MNIRKSIDYSDLYAGIDRAVAAGLAQMELYLELGKLVSSRPEKGAAVMAAEYINTNYPNRTGFSPRNLRRMRDFAQMYRSYSAILAQAMKVGWTQNIVIMEADLDMDARLWYLQAVRRFGWSKAELARQINAGAYLENENKMCYTENDKNAVEMSEDDKDRFHRTEGQPAEPDCSKGIAETATVSGADQRISNRDCLCGRASSGAFPPSPKQRLRPLRSAHRDGAAGSPGDVPYLRRGFRGQNAPVPRPVLRFRQTGSKTFCGGYSGGVPELACEIEKVVIGHNMRWSLAAGGSYG